MPWPCSVAIIHEDDVSRGGLCSALHEAGIAVAFECRRPEERPFRASPDLVLTDVAFGKTQRPGVVRELREAYPEAKVAVITTVADPQVLLAGLLEGAQGFFMPDIGATYLVQSLRTMYECDAVILGPRFIEALKAQIPHVLNLAPLSDSPKLTDEEQKLLPLLTEGLTIAAMGETLGLSPRTVDRRMRSLLGKLGARSAFEAGAKAAKWGLT
jgi:two-component system response regulator DevR